MAQSLYQDAVSALDKTRLKNSFKEMLAIRSENPFDEPPQPGFREQEMAEYLGDMLGRTCFTTRLVDVVPGRPNIYATKQGTTGNVSLMLAGHMDTVRTDGYPDAYDITEKNDRIYGRGACDMKAALAAYLEAARILHETGSELSGSLIIAGLCDEEYRMIGSKHVGANGPAATWGIIGEPSNLAICPANRGQLGSTIRTFGTSVHSSVQHEGINAIIHMARIIEAFAGYNEELSKAHPHPLLGHGCFNPGVIRGGTVLSAVPDLCELEIDRRFLPRETVEQIYAEYHRIIAPLADTVDDFRYEISAPTWEIGANDVPVDSAVVEALVRAVETATPRDAEIRPFPAGSDAPYMGFPTVICGPGSLTQAHGINEYVDTDQLVAAVKIYLHAIYTLLV